MVYNELIVLRTVSFQSIQLTKTLTNYLTNQPAVAQFKPNQATCCRTGASCGLNVRH